jgi:predicted acetyltransferase
VREHVERARACPPTPAVRDSHLAGERRGCVTDGLSSEWLGVAGDDFDTFATRRASVREQWGVPVTELWYVDGADYIGTVVIRHHLTPPLQRDGGHIGFNVVPGCRGRGYATKMLGAAIPACRRLGLTQLLITASVDNIASRRVIEANGGVLQDTDSAARYLLAI